LAGWKAAFYSHTGWAGHWLAGWDEEAWPLAIADDLAT